jgi:hypothetical protein
VFTRVPSGFVLWDKWCGRGSAEGFGRAAAGEHDFERVVVAEPGGVQHGDVLDDVDSPGLT